MTAPSQQTINVPEGFMLATSKYISEFDSQTLEDDDKELWLVRVPENLTAKDIASMKWTLPKPSSHTPLGKLSKNKDNYALYRVPEEHEKHKKEHDDDEEDYDFGISGQEMAGFQCLLPCQQKSGKLVFASKPFQHRFIVNELVEIPNQP
ncbi:hypothetical protein BDF14DRAFT_1882940 [Spinellus fusiger]|nr:hypothetical protein BDF14DRAFT_1882940 [Spinellus fusiger]